jgi:hypothetical protein
VTFAISYSPLARAQIDALTSPLPATPQRPRENRWKAIRRVLVDYLPTHALRTDHLRLGRGITGIRVIHIGARDRVVWIASKEKSAAVVLMLGLVLEGDTEDSYQVVREQLRLGRFNTAFTELGVPKPDEDNAPGPRFGTLLAPANEPDAPTLVIPVPAPAVAPSPRAP